MLVYLIGTSTFLSELTDQIITLHFFVVNVCHCFLSLTDLDLCQKIKVIMSLVSKNKNKLKYVTSPCVYYVSWLPFSKRKDTWKSTSGAEPSICTPPPRWRMWMWPVWLIHPQKNCSWSGCILVNVYSPFISAHFLSAFDILLGNLELLGPGFLMNCQFLGGCEKIILWIWNWSIIINCTV